MSQTVQTVHSAVATAPVAKEVVKQTVTVVKNDLGSVLNVFYGLLVSATGLAVAHWVFLNDRLSKGQNKALASVYSLVLGLIATLIVNNWKVPVDLSAAGELVAFSAAALGSAQGLYNLITAKPVSTTPVVTETATPETSTPEVPVADSSAA